MPVASITDDNIDILHKLHPPSLSFPLGTPPAETNKIVSKIKTTTKGPLHPLTKQNHANPLTTLMSATSYKAVKLIAVLLPLSFSCNEPAYEFYL